MDIKDLIGKGVTIAIGIDDLWNFMDGISQKFTPPKAERYLSPKQVCEMLDIDNSTLWRWGQSSYLIPFKVGGKNRYKMSEIEKLLNHE